MTIRWGKRGKIAPPKLKKSAPVNVFVNIFELTPHMYMYMYIRRRDMPAAIGTVTVEQVGREQQTDVVLAVTCSIPTLSDFIIAR